MTTAMSSTPSSCERSGQAEVSPTAAEPYRGPPSCTEPNYSQAVREDGQHSLESKIENESLSLHESSAGSLGPKAMVSRMPVPAVVPRPAVSESSLASSPPGSLSSSSAELGNYTSNPMGTDGGPVFSVLLIGFGNVGHVGHIRHRHRGYAIDGGSIAESSSASDSDAIVCRLPWGGDISAYGFLGRTTLQLPAFAVVVGLAMSLNDLDMTASEVHRIPYNRDITHCGGFTFHGLTHLAFRKSTHAELTRCIARRIRMVDGNSTFHQICESGPVLADIAKAEEVSPRLFKSALQSYDSSVVIISTHHRLVGEDELRSSKVHSIPNPTDPQVIERIMERLSYHGGIVGISLHLYFLPWLFLLIGAVLWTLPGLIQWLGGEDRNWASILNQCIGTGSVLLGVVLYTVRKLFTHTGFRDVIVGKLVLQNDAAARFLVPSFVTTLQSAACDPRLPEDLIANDFNSAVRVARDGWLRICKRIPVTDAFKHGYHILMDKGVALDLLEGKIYKMRTTESGNEEILRRGEASDDWSIHIVSANAKIE